MTIALWIRVTGLVDTGSPTYFDIGTASGGSGTYGVNLRRLANQTYDSTGTVDKNYSINGSSSFTLKDNTWVHLAFIITAGSSAVTWYKNGVAQTVLTDANPANYPATTTSINVVQLGSSNTVADKGLIGQIDRFQIYDVDIDDSFAAQIGASRFNDVKLYYKFDAILSGSFYEEVLKNYSMTGSRSTVTKKFGVGSFSASGRNSTSYTIPAGNITFALWLYLPTSQSNATGHVFGWSTSSYFFKNIGLRLNTNTSPYGFSAYSDASSGTPEYKTIGTSTLTALTWNHIVLVFSTASPATCTVYLNGVLQTTVTFTIGIDTTNPRLYRDCLVTAGYTTVTGFIDDFRYYERALSANDVTALLNYSY
jgi:hypothetical protein